jgi:hypothetical protein
MVPFWDFSNDTLFLNHRNLFHDFDHLNNTGAKIFSNIIAEKLKDNISSNLTSSYSIKY